METLLISQNNNFLSLELNIMNKLYQNYKNIDTDINISIGDFHINFKPNTILYLFSFISNDKNNNEFNGINEGENKNNLIEQNIADKDSKIENEGNNQ